jgi:hypothetical protein
VGKKQFWSETICYHSNVICIFSVWTKVCELNHALLEHNRALGSADRVHCKLIVISRCRL